MKQFEQGGFFKKPMFVVALLVSFIPLLIVAAEELPAYCYLPTENNVSYASVLELPTSVATTTLKYADEPLQFGELWLPPTAHSSSIDAKQNEREKSQIRHPLVVLIHGGCWLNEYNIDHTHALSSALAASGYAVWAIEYRRTGDEGGGWPGTFDDIKAGIQFTQTLNKYPLDLSKLTIIGHSAGGHLALLAGSDKKLVESANIGAVVGLAAITDIEEYSKGTNDCQTAVKGFMGGSAQELKQHYLAANPSLKPRHTETFLLHGSQDKIVPVGQAQLSQTTSTIISNAGHFDMIHPATPSYRALLQVLGHTY